MATDTLNYKARLAEQIELCNEMKDAMKELVESGKTLSEDERNLLSVAYKNVVGQRRSSWRSISNLEPKVADEPERLKVCKEFREKIEQELTELCDEILGLLQTYLVKDLEQSPADTDPKVLETAVFFYKMKGDYLRYKVEITHNDNHESLSNEAEAAYKVANDMAAFLQPTHPIRLGLALNFSVYYYEIATDPKKACDLAREAFDSAMQDLDETKNETYKDSTLIMQLLRDNLTLWASPNDDEQ